MMIWFVANVALATEIVGGDWGGGDLLPVDGDILEGTFTNVGQFIVPTGATVYVQHQVELNVSAQTIVVDGVLSGVGAGLGGGKGGEYTGTANDGNDGNGPGHGVGGLAGPCVHGGGGGGGGFGGPGGDGGYYFAGNTGFGGDRFGDPYDPTYVYLGSGGGGGGSGCYVDGGKGGAGGAAIVLFSGDITISGTIDASGAKGETPGNYSGGGGGGSGGTVQIDAGIIEGSGTIVVKGGDGGDNGSQAGLESGGGGGGGGRIKLYWGQTLSDTLIFAAGGGKKGVDQNAANSNKSANGTDGTVWTENVDPDGDRDGILKADDNCPEVANVDQVDQDDDGIGDACDDCPIDPVDSDFDGVCDSVDVCPGGDDTLDLDGDFQPDECDCDMEDPFATTNGVEQCDGMDNNCDGVIDPPGSEGELTYFLDLDGDGYGRYQESQFACEPPLNYVPVGGDCDDDKVAISPAGAEFCDGVDNDCDGIIDQQCAEGTGEGSASSCGGCDNSGSPAGAGLLGLAAAVALTIRRRR